MCVCVCECVCVRACVCVCVCVCVTRKKEWILCAEFFGYKIICPVYYLVLLAMDSVRDLLRIINYKLGISFEMIPNIMS